MNSRGSVLPLFQKYKEKGFFLENHLIKGEGHSISQEMILLVKKL